jgi:hypothetical protein
MTKIYKPEDLRGIASKCQDGSWVATAYIETPDKILVIAVSHGKKMNSTLNDVMSKAIQRVEAGEVNEVKP